MTSRPNAARKPSRKTARKKPTRKKPAKKMGRPRIEFDLEEIHKLAALHCTDEEIAAWVGCSIGTIENRRRDDPEFLGAIQKGRAQGKMSLRRSMFRTAEKGNATMQIWLSKNWLGYSDNPVIEDSRDHALVLSTPDGHRVRIGPDRPLPGDDG